MSTRRKKVGLPPGSVVFTGNKKVDKVHIHYLQYDKESLVEKTLDNYGLITFRPAPAENVDWYDIRGLHDTALIEEIGTTFNIHSLVLEHISDTFQRPKFEEHQNGIFIIIKALYFDKSELKIFKEHVAFYFRDGLVLTFQETETDLFSHVRTRIQSGQGKIRFKGADYLVYALLDVLVDSFLLVLEDIGEQIESLEERIVDNQESQTKVKIHQLRKELFSIRRSIVPLREAIGRFTKVESELVSTNTAIFIRDLYDHTIQIMDSVDSFRDLLNGLQDLFISEVSFKMNQVMQMLTLVATIFIPLTFLAGIYGMNFENIPELKWPNGYFYLLGVMILISTILLIFFKRKKWL